jgi:capsule polysaccharide export protein KpsE/RkpR
MTFHQIIHTILFNIRTILTTTIISALIIFIYLLLISPVSYKAPVTILPPAEQDNFGGLGSFISGGDFSALLPSSFTQGNSQLFLEILKSRSAAEFVVNSNNLIDYYGTETVYEACIKLQNDLDLDLSKEGIITLSVNVSTSFIPLIFANKDSVKNFAALISNSYVEALDKINREKISFKAKRAREYIENQLLLTKAQLDSAEHRLMEFQKTNKAISLPDQLKSAIEGSAEIKSEIIKTEIEIGLLEPNLKDDNKTLVALRKKLSELKQEYDKFEIGTEDYLIAFESVPELGMELAQLLREVKIQSEVYLLLQQQYYREKIQENRDLPTIEILDEAIPPLKVSSPRIIYSSVVSAVFIFLLLSLYFVLKEKRLNLFKDQRKN